MRRPVPLLFALGLGIAIASCAEQDRLSGVDGTESTGPSTSTTLRIDRPDDTADPNAPVDVTSPVEDELIDEAVISGRAAVQIDGERYEIDVYVSDCSFDLDGAWDVNGRTVADGVTVGFSTSYQQIPGIDGGESSWQLLVYLSFDLGERGTYQHFHDTASDLGQPRPSINAGPDRLQVRAEFVDPTGILLEPGDDTAGRVDVVCS